MEIAVFILFAALALGSALLVVLHRNPVNATMSLVVTLVSVAALFVLLGAPFLAALQILIYTGAIVVLFLFVIMLLNVQRETREDSGGDAQTWIVLLAASLFAGLLIALLWRSHGADAAAPLRQEFVSLRALARLLFTRYMLPFQLIGLLLLAAVTAATVMARRPTPDETPERGAS